MGTSRFPRIATAFDPHHRFIYVPHNTTSLYRSIKLKQGISQRSLLHKNIHLWFNTENPCPPLPELTDACLFYQPFLQGKTDQFIIILSTSEQRACAWRYPHRQTIIVDLMFGFSSARTVVYNPGIGCRSVLIEG